MEIVIRIPEEMYKWVNDVNKFFDDYGTSDFIDLVKNGILLPKGHGRLIDADEAIKKLKSLGNRDYRREKGTIQDAEKMLSYDGYTPTIIEADKKEK